MELPTGTPNPIVAATAMATAAATTVPTGPKTPVPSVEPAPKGPQVDRSERKVSSFSFTAKEADSRASTHLGKQTALIDTSADPRGRLVIFLHGAGRPGTCGQTTLSSMLAGWGYHVFSPCYVSDYGVGNCGRDIEGCRREAFEGVDHHPFVEIAAPDSIETRVVMGLRHLQSKHPEGGWAYFIEKDKPRWSSIVVAGHSHGASSAGLIGLFRDVARVVMFAGPLDANQAWLGKAPLTPRDRYFGFTHTGDGQHQGHLAAFETLRLPGEKVDVGAVKPPYGNSHRFFSARAVGDGHGAVVPGGGSPRENGTYVFEPVWKALFDVVPN